MPAETELAVPVAAAPAEERHEQSARSAYPSVMALEKLRQLSLRIHDRAAGQAPFPSMPAED